MAIAMAFSNYDFFIDNVEISRFSCGLPFRFIAYKQRRKSMPRKFDPSAKAKNAIADNLQIYQHMNFLHQAAILLSSLPKEDSQTADSSNTQQALKPHVTSRDKSTIIDKPNEPALAPLSRYYCYTMKNISKKLVLRL
jgi:hypothetical protein